MINMFLAGDSTVSNYDSSTTPRAGWGQVFQSLLDAEVTVRNAASSGRSSKSFIDEGRLAVILERIGPGDYLFVQFGHNDEKDYDPSRYTEPATTYKSYLKQYIDGARSKGAIPVLVTPVERRGFEEDGTLIASHGLYPAAMLELGQELEVPVLDLTSKSRALFSHLGPEETKELFLWQEPGVNENYPDGVQDNTHFQEQGAIQIAQLVAEGIKELALPLAKHLISRE